MTRLKIEPDFTVSGNLRYIHSTPDQNNGFEKVLLIIDNLLVFPDCSITIALIIGTVLLL